MRNGRVDGVGGGDVDEAAMARAGRLARQAVQESERNRFPRDSRQISVLGRNSSRGEASLKIGRRRTFREDSTCQDKCQWTVSRR